MDTWILQMCRAKYRNQVVAWGLTAALGLAIAFANTRYIGNFVRGPFNVGAAELEQLGDVTLSHALDLDQSPGTGQSGDPALVYHSDRAGYRPIVQISLPSANTGALPGLVNRRRHESAPFTPHGTRR